MIIIGEVVDKVSAHKRINLNFTIEFQFILSKTIHKFIIDLLQMGFVRMCEHCIELLLYSA